MSKQKLKISEILTLNAAFTFFDQIPGDDRKMRPKIKLAYAIGKNQDKISGIIKGIGKMSQRTPEFQAYDSERVKLAERWADKDEKRAPVIEGKSYKISDMVGFNDALESLRKKHKKAMVDAEKQDKEILEYLETEEAVEIHKVRLSEFPEEIHTSVLKAMGPMIEDE